VLLGLLGTLTDGMFIAAQNWKGHVVKHIIYSRTLSSLEENLKMASRDRNM